MTNNLTKEEAIIALVEGAMITHRAFTSNEWVRQVGGMYEFEDGISLAVDDFWHIKSQDLYLDGWSVIELVDGRFYEFSSNEKQFLGKYDSESKSFILDPKNVGCDRVDRFLACSVLHIVDV